MTKKARGCLQLKRYKHPLNKNSETLLEMYVYFIKPQATGILLY